MKKNVLVSMLLASSFLSLKAQIPADNYLAGVKIKRALIVVAHDDDATGCTGTFSKLASEGWELSFICFYNLLTRPEDVPARKKAMLKVAKTSGIKNIEFIDFIMRNGQDTVKNMGKLLHTPPSEFHTAFKEDSIRFYILRAIEKYQPTVIFSLDDIIGGYGNAEHVIVSKMAHELFTKGRVTAPFPVKKIYQAVLLNSYADSIFPAKINWLEAKNVFSQSGMPAPTVSVDVSAFAKQKRKCFMAFKTEAHNFRKIWPGYTKKGYFLQNHMELFHVVEE